MRGCSTTVEVCAFQVCGDELGSATEHGCGRVFCDHHLFIPPAGVKLRGGGVCEHCLATVVVHACTTCPGHALCVHDLAAAPLAEVLANHFKAPAGPPPVSTYMLAHELVETVGVGPYEVGPLDLLSRSQDGRYVDGVVINGWEIGLPTERTAEVIGEVGKPETGVDAARELQGAVAAA